MKTLHVYRGSSFWRFENIGGDFIFSVSEPNSLQIYKRNRINGEESLYAGFKDWDYFLIDEEV